MIYGIVLGVHVLVCLALVLVVLLQASKGGGLAGAFGGGAESTVFGGRGAATVLSKATTVFGAAFMITSLTLTLMSTSHRAGPRSIVAEDAAQAPLGAPATGTAPPTGTLPVPGGNAGGTLPAPAGDASGSAPATQTQTQTPPAQDAGDASGGE